MSISLQKHKYLALFRTRPKAEKLYAAFDLIIHTFLFSVMHQHDVNWYSVLI